MSRSLDFALDDIARDDMFRTPGITMSVNVRRDGSNVSLRHWLPKREGTHLVGRTAVKYYCHPPNLI